MGEAFEVYAFDYLVKPFRLDRLEQTLERIESRLRRSPEQPLAAPRPAEPRNAAGRLMLKHRDGVTFVDMQDILLVQREDPARLGLAPLGAEDGPEEVLPWRFRRLHWQLRAMPDTR